jgi:D-alanyl-D-alanine carboxypeptidase
MNYLPATGQISSFRIRNNTDSFPETGSNLVRCAGHLFAPSLIITLLVALLTACSSGKGAEGANSESPDGDNAAALSTLSASPSSVSRDLDPKLARVLDPLLNNSDYRAGRWGVAVVSLADGKLIYDHNGSNVFTPASNMKIYTTAVALDLLGTDYRWRTSVYATAPPDPSGTVHGDLILYGRGAPDLLSANAKENSNSLAELALALVKRGITHVQGNVIGDESYFRGDPIGNGWQWNDLQWYFGAEASALTVNENAVDLNISPPRDARDKPNIVSSDNDGYIQIINNVAVVERRSPFRLGMQRGLSDNNVTLWGEIPMNSSGYGVRLSVHHAAGWAARLFLSALRANGVFVDGDAGRAILEYRKSRDSIPRGNKSSPQSLVARWATLSRPSTRRASTSTLNCYFVPSVVNEARCCPAPNLRDENAATMKPERI